MSTEDQDATSNKDTLVIVVRDAKGKQIDYLTWKPGQPRVSNQVFGIGGTQVQCVAYGEARDWIYRHFEGLRMNLPNTKNYTTWVGEDAAFIANNVA